MSQNTQGNDFGNQQRVAEALEVDRTTIRAWAKKGMPYIQGDRGKENIYHISTCMWWMLGKEFAEKRKIEGLTAVQQIIFARVIADEYDPGDDLASEEWMSKILSNVGIGLDEVSREVAFVRGLMRGIILAKNNKRAR